MDEKSMPKGAFYLNNERIVLRGTNEMGHLPLCVMRGDYEQLIDDILIAKVANLNFYRMTQRPVHDEIYTYFDMLGMLCQSDFPLFSYLKPSAVGEALKPLSDYAGKGLKTAANSAIDFESAFADVKKTVKTTEDEFTSIRAGLLDLSERVPTTASDLAKIAGLAGQMNVGADDIVWFTKKMVDFGNATNITAEEAVTDIAQIYNVIGKGGNFDTLDNLLSTIVELGNNTATTEKDIVQMFTNIAAGASRVGMTEAQMAALAATLSSLNLDKGGASAISKILTTIDKQVALRNSRPHGRKTPQAL